MDTFAKCETNCEAGRGTKKRKDVPVDRNKSSLKQEGSQAANELLFDLYMSIYIYIY